MAVAVAGVARKGHARGARVAHIAENHCLYVNGSTPIVRDIFNIAVSNSAFAVPRGKHRTDSAPKLFHRIVREVFFEHFFDGLFKFRAQFFEFFGRNMRIVRYAEFCL